MTQPMNHFDGKPYLTAHDSEPHAMGWMQGSPPPPGKTIRFADNQFLDFPQNRWALSHMRELMPTVNVWRGDAPPSPLGAVDAATQAAIDALAFTDMNGQPRTWLGTLADTYTDGLVVLHRGQRVYERYAGALQPHGTHACFSITKSYAATLAALLLHDKLLDATRTVAHYLPEMAHTAYADATLRQLLDMQIGVHFSELYSDPQAHIWNHARAGGLLARKATDGGPASFYEFLQTLKKQGEHGQAFAYQTVNTDVLCWVMKRVTGQGLAELLSQRIWQRLGCEEDACISVDAIGVAFGGGGMSATLRDLARFGELMRCDGARGSDQIVPAQAVADIRRGADPAKFAKAGYTLLPGYSYRNMWWVTHNALGAFEARGIHGQRLYVAPQAELVVARFASHPIASSAANDPITLPAFAALAAWLMTR
jgi:CubicO group peptidase (beta-lactamase class C family)